MSHRHRSVLSTSLGLVLAGLLAGPALAQDRVANVYNWSDYIDEDVLKEFTAETGISVVYDVYDNNDIVETKLLAGGSGYDIVVPTDSNVARMIQAGVVLPLDKSAVPNLSNMWPEIMDRMAKYDPDNAHAVPYMWGTTAFGYNAAKIAERMPDAPVDSWDMVFKPEVISKFADCGVHILDAPEDVFQSALNYLGIPPDSKDTADLEKAAALIQSIRPYIQKFHSSEYINALANGEICLAVGYSGDILQARARAEEAGAGVEINYVIPKEGALIWIDSMIIPDDAPHPAEALEFINFMNRPEIAARNSNYVAYANGNLASQQFLDDAVKNDAAVYPPAETLARLFTSTPYEQDVQRVLTRLWTDIKAGS